MGTFFDQRKLEKEDKLPIVLVLYFGERKECFCFTCHHNILYSSKTFRTICGHDPDNPSEAWRYIVERKQVAVDRVYPVNGSADGPRELNLSARYDVYPPKV